MSVQARSADGVVHSFPAGTPDEVVDRVMREYAQKGAPKPQASAVSAPPAAPKPSKALEDARRRAASTPGQVRAITRGGSFGFVDELDALSAAAETGGRNLLSKTGLVKPAPYSASEAYGAVMTAEKEAQQAFAKSNPVQSMAGEIIGSIPTGNALLKAPGMLGMARLAPKSLVARAAVTGGTQGALYGLGTANEGERVKGAVTGGMFGAGSGALLQAGGNALARKAAEKVANPSKARILANAGVRLTPGDVLGGGFKRTEDALTSVPGAGDMIRARKIDGIKSFDRSVGNRVLSEIGQKVEPGLTGRALMADVSDKVSAVYQRALEPVTVVPDATFVANAYASRKATSMTPELTAELDAVLKNTVGPALGKTMTGPEWKVVDSDLATAIRDSQGGKASNKYLVDALKAVRKEWQGLLERTDASAFAQVKSADNATANLIRMRKAASSTGTAARDELFTGADLNRAVAAGESRNYGTGDALMQDLSDAAQAVLPQTVPDSGTAFRSLVQALTGAGIGSAGAGAVGVPAEALTTAGAVALGANAAIMGLYSKPVIALFNAAYRAGGPGQRERAVAGLMKLAESNPAARNEVTRALEALRAQSVGQPPTPEAQQVPMR